jgi:hypothetical protein
LGRPVKQVFFEASNDVEFEINSLDRIVAQTESGISRYESSRPSQPSFSRRNGGTGFTGSAAQK